MKKLIFYLIILIFHSLTVESQNYWESLLKRIPEYKLPFLIDSVNKPKVVRVNRNEVYYNLILPVTSLNKLKPDSMRFIFDSTSLACYKFWDKYDWKKVEPLNLRCPIQVGKLYCIGRLKFQNHIGIIWMLTDSAYFIGQEYWLFIHEDNGKLIDFINISRYKVSNYEMGICRECSMKKSAYINDNNEIFLNILIRKLAEEEEEGKEKTYLKSYKLKYTINADGKITITK